MSEVTTEKLIEDCKVLVNDAEELIKATADNVGGQIAALRQRLVEGVEKGKAGLARRKEVLREQAEQTRARAIGVAQDKGWRRLALGVGAGILIGLAVRCQRRRPAKPEA
jgi:ElaB/YqjD/DUF883 family membrane-anchored ribosome-binding protein